MAKLAPANPDRVAAGELDPYRAADELLDAADAVRGGPGG